MPDASIGNHTVESRSAAWARTIADPNQQTLVAAIDEQVVGFSYFGPSRENDAPASEAEIIAIYVHPDHLRKGIGRELCMKSIENLPGFTRLILWVLRDNEAARQFYEVMGFQLVPGKEKKLPWFGNRPEVCYRKQLSP
jgi:GNAT superfamily N-acetyltransferase